MIFLEHELLYGTSFDVISDPDLLVPIGKGNVVREGPDLTITAFSLMVGKAIEAANN